MRLSTCQERAQLWVFPDTAGGASCVCPAAAGSVALSAAVSGCVSWGCTRAAALTEGHPAPLLHVPRAPIPRKAPVWALLSSEASVSRDAESSDRDSGSEIKPYAAEKSLRPPRTPAGIGFRRSHEDAAVPPES